VALELITGQPPYYNQPAMAAMFRIVADQHPPLPPNVSSVRSPPPLQPLDLARLTHVGHDDGVRSAGLGGFPVAMLAQGSAGATDRQRDAEPPVAQQRSPKRRAGWGTQ
jgi:hypothetical protein